MGSQNDMFGNGVKIFRYWIVVALFFPGCKVICDATIIQGIGALDIFRGIIVRGNINLYTAIIALAFSKGKDIMVMVMLPKEQWF